MKVWKAHGLGNDYLVWEGNEGFLSAERVKTICHRHRGVGADGILEPTGLNNGVYGVRIWNPDGSVAEKSGNGLRIFAWWLHYEQGAPAQFDINTGFGIVHANLDKELVSIGMGQASFRKEDSPCVLAEVSSARMPLADCRKQHDDQLLQLLKFRTQKIYFFMS